jgi:hypothetical protein
VLVLALYDGIYIYIYILVTRYTYIVYSSVAAQQAAALLAIAAQKVDLIPHAPLDAGTVRGPLWGLGRTQP